MLLLISFLLYLFYSKLVESYYLIQRIRKRESREEEKQVRTCCEGGKSGDKTNQGSLKNI
jgi:hypothetical protein